MNKIIKLIKADKIICFIKPPFPVVYGSRQMPSTYLVQIGNGEHSEVTVWQCKLSLEGFEPFSGVVTSRSSIEFKGFGQHGYIDESYIVFSAAKAYCDDHNLQFCSSHCTWPYLVAGVNHLKTS